jgi:hypothetical protein
VVGFATTYCAVTSFDAPFFFFFAVVVAGGEVGPDSEEVEPWGVEDTTPGGGDAVLVPGVWGGVATLVVWGEVAALVVGC